MFCPECKAEYREGFTRCTDCDVALVDSPSEGQTGADMEDPVVVWRGTDPSAFSAALAALKEAGIPSFEISDHDQLVWGLAMPRPRYRIMVKRMDMEAAERLVEPFGERAGWAHARDIWKGKNEFLHDDEENSQEDSAKTPPRAENGLDDIPPEFDPKKATALVWSGKEEMADTIKVCLRENGIDCVIAPRGKELRVLVVPDFEERAKEIVREIVEATAPE